MIFAHMPEYSFQKSGARASKKKKKNRNTAFNVFVSVFIPERDRGKILEESLQAISHTSDVNCREFATS
jgi:hypothetical protein